ncbi:hypothetical protein BLNAU_11517 [Blattamonas nauphoetae]|uniref:Uncharacterized protein n=1 Tax=Blattamonas nauphoetae TaxID=2049346 RepID=A0ABQ9XRT2_9EUKA|nr:hypothetical protein BLNAU_11517 [Blattamonas nauphoetae]
MPSETSKPQYTNDRHSHSPLSNSTTAQSSRTGQMMRAQNSQPQQPAFHDILSQYDSLLPSEECPFDMYCSHQLEQTQVQAITLFHEMENQSSSQSSPTSLRPLWEEYADKTYVHARLAKDIPAVDRPVADTAFSALLPALTPLPSTQAQLQWILDYLVETKLRREVMEQHIQERSQGQLQPVNQPNKQPEPKEEEIQEEDNYKDDDEFENNDSGSTSSFIDEDNEGNARHETAAIERNPIASEDQDVSQQHDGTEFGTVPAYSPYPSSDSLDPTATPPNKVVGKHSRQDPHSHSPLANTSTLSPDKTPKSAEKARISEEEKQMRLDALDQSSPTRPAESVLGSSTTSTPSERKAAEQASAADSASDEEETEDETDEESREGGDGQEGTSGRGGSQEQTNSNPSRPLTSEEEGELLRRFAHEEHGEIDVSRPDPDPEDLEEEEDFTGE